MGTIAFIIFFVIYIVVTYLFKVIDHITDYIVNKTYKNKTGISHAQCRSILFPLLGIAPFNEISAEFFDIYIVKWGVSRDFLVFKDKMGQSNIIEKRKLKEWEQVFNGDTKNDN
jgi:hypothetical protein